LFAEQRAPSGLEGDGFPSLKAGRAIAWSDVHWNADVGVDGLSLHRTLRWNPRCLPSRGIYTFAMFCRVC
jgi:hypothetical protein